MLPRDKYSMGSPGACTSTVSKSPPSWITEFPGRDFSMMTRLKPGPAAALSSSSLTLECTRTAGTVLFPWARIRTLPFFLFTTISEAFTLFKITLFSPPPDTNTLPAILTLSKVIFPSPMPSVR
ncbi:hypothetical protein D3C75_902790 [compost metagenome]